MDRQVRILGLAVIGIVAAGFAGLYFGAGTTFRTDAAAALGQRLQQLSLVALIIERTVEVYLGVSGQNGEDRHDSSDRSGLDAKRTATLVALLIGAAVAICGLRVLDAAVVSPAPGAAIPFDVQHIVWTGIDILLTAGLIAGGSYILHEVAETVVGGIKYVDPMRAKVDAEKAQKADAESDS